MDARAEAKIDEDARILLEKTASALNISSGSASSDLHVCARWIPCIWTVQHKRDRVALFPQNRELNTNYYGLSLLSNHHWHCLAELVQICVPSRSLPFFFGLQNFSNLCLQKQTLSMVVRPFASLLHKSGILFLSLSVTALSCIPSKLLKRKAIRFGTQSVCLSPIKNQLASPNTSN